MRQLKGDHSPGHQHAANGVVDRYIHDDLEAIRAATALVPRLPKGLCRDALRTALGLSEGEGKVSVARSVPNRRSDLGRFESVETPVDVQEQFVAEMVIHLHLVTKNSTSSCRKQKSPGTKGRKFELPHVRLA